MKKAIIGFTLLLVSLVAVAMTSTADEEKSGDYIVHEWGTFTSVSGSDGEFLDGLYLEEEQLPGFVHEIKIPHDPMLAVKFRGFGLPPNHLKGVNIKMETPVIYFYSDEERTVDVNVKFKNGVVNQWYPQSSNDRTKVIGVDPYGVDSIYFKDFKVPFTDTIDWKAKVLSENTKLSYTNPQDLETPTWVNPRFTDSNLIQVGKEREKFIFYRGLARFQQPFKVTAQSDSQITLKNTGSDQISFALVYEYTKDKKANVWWTGKLEGSEGKVVQKKELDVNKSIHGAFLDGLVEAGLYRKEAQSMLETWRHSYFEKEGLRVFWIVPRKFTDEILPITLKPAPKKLERVLVGRTEVLTPEFEEKLVKEFTTNEAHFPFWSEFKNFNFSPDRYFRAWQNRVMKLMDEKKYKFSFLSKISGEAPRPGEFMINVNRDKPNGRYLSKLGNHYPFFYYMEKSGIMEGEAIYYYQLPKVRWSYQQNPEMRYMKAVFTMKKGVPDGECLIYELIDNKEILEETKTFKDGKVL